jgi:site-specific recombinase XerD
MKYLNIENYKYTELYIASMTVERRKTIKVKVRGLSEEGIDALLKSIDVSTEVGLRDCILWQVVYLTGMRISEVLSIKLKHLNLKAKKPSVTVVGKRDKIRTPYLPAVLVKNLNGYIQRIFGKQYDEESFLFFSRVKGKFQPLTVKGAEERLKKNAAVAHKVCKDVPLDLHPHMLRHSFATHRLDHGMNIIQLSEILGHNDVSTTMRYLDISEKQTEEAVKLLEDEKVKSIKKKWNSNTQQELKQLFAKSK